MYLLSQVPSSLRKIWAETSEKFRFCRSLKGGESLSLLGPDLVSTLPDRENVQFYFIVILISNCLGLYHRGPDVDRVENARIFASFNPASLIFGI